MYSNCPEKVSATYLSPLRQTALVQESFSGLDGVDSLLFGGLLADPGEDPVGASGVQNKAILRDVRKMEF